MLSVFSHCAFYFALVFNDLLLHYWFLNAFLHLMATSSHLRLYFCPKPNLYSAQRDIHHAWRGTRIFSSNSRDITRVSEWSSIPAVSGVPQGSVISPVAISGVRSQARDFAFDITIMTNLDDSSLSSSFPLFFCSVYQAAFKCQSFISKCFEL